MEIRERIGGNLPTLCFLLILIPIGFLSKTASGNHWKWIGDHLAGSFYELFWILSIYLFFSGKVNILVLPLTVFSLTCLLEFGQLWHPFWLEQLRLTFPGRILLGTTFSLWDFPFYFGGCLAGWLWLYRCEKRRSEKKLFDSQRSV